MVAAYANSGGRVAWVAPTYKNSRPMWRWLEGVTLPLQRHGVQISRAERHITFPNGGGVGVFSADNPVGIRGEAFHLVVVDEAARVSEETYQDAIRPTLADFDGDLMLISTPAGRNWFHAEYQRAVSDGIEAHAWHAATEANPIPNIQKAFVRARETLPTRSFQQEWLAEFVADGAVFRNVRACATAAHDTPEQHAGHNVVFGVDWAAKVDFTVIVAFCADCRRMVEMDRFNQVAWAIQRGRLSAMRDRWQPYSIIAESNSIGGPNIEALQGDGLPVVAFETTATSKPPLIQSLVLAFERGELRILPDDTLIGELESYEERRNATTGRPSYSAPEGMHDDTVMALALAWYGYANGRSQIETVPNREYSIGG